MTKAMKTRAERVYRLLLILLPRSLRAGFEDEMTHHFLRRLRDARGPIPRAGVWLRALGDLLGQGVSEVVLHKVWVRAGGWKVGAERIRAGNNGGESGEAGDGGPGRDRAAIKSPWDPGRRHPFDAMAQDFRFAARILRRSPSFTLVAAFTLALGIGCTTVAFGLVRGVLLRPLPFPGDGELVVIRERGLEGRAQSLSFPNFEDFRDHSRAFSGIAALRFAAAATILGGAEPVRGTVVPVSREFFSVLGVMPALGRPILPEENRSGGESVAVVSFEFWTRALGSDERLDGLGITVSGTSYSVVGIMPPGFRVLEEADVYLPLEQNPFRVRSSSNYRGVGRLAEGVTLPQAQVELDGIAGRILAAYPDDARMDGVLMRPLREEILGNLTRPLFLLLSASGLLLLLACSNVASTLMARSIRRQREMAIRTAVGGGKGVLVRQVFTESLLLAGFSGLLGVGITLGSLEILRLFGTDFIPRLATVSVVAVSLKNALGATLLTSLVFGLLPAFRLPEPASALRSGSGGSGPITWGHSPRGRSRRRRKGAMGWSFLVGCQVALAVSLVVVSALLLRSMGEILSADTKFRQEGVLTLALDFSAAEFASIEDRGAKLRELKGELASLPGVSEVGFVSHLPNVRRMMTGAVFRPPFPVEGYPDYLAQEVGWRVVDEDYFRVMGIPLLKGRTFSAEDGPDSRPVIVLNEALEWILFPGEEAVGEVVQFVPFWQEVDLEVVGVVAEARDWRVPAGEQLEGYVFWPQRLGYTRQLTAVLLARGDPAALVAPARERLRAVAPSIPGTFRTLEALVADSFRDRSFTLGVLGVFTLLALFLSAVGIYGVVSYSISARTREIGIMLALGADTGRLRARLFIRAARPVAVGLAVGVALALVTGGVLESVLFQVSPRDPQALAAAPLVLLCSASLAILLPVFRYTRVDPAGSMREE
jgi:predicted permease